MDVDVRHLTGSCQSPHPTKPQLGYRALLWRRPYNSGRVRVAEWTCDCANVFYELCEAAGLAFIRKTIKGRAVMDPTRG